MKSESHKTEGSFEESILKKRALDHFVNGTVFEAQNNYHAAVIEFEKALQYDTTAGIYYSLSKNYLFTNRLIQSLSIIKKAVELDSSILDYYDLMADVYSAARNYDSAIAVLEKAALVEPNNINLYYKLARLYEISKPLEAISVYEKLIDLVGPDWNLLVRIGELYEKTGNLELALESIERLLELDPSNTQLKTLLIDFNQRAGNHDKAIRIADDLLELTPDDLSIRERKALILVEIEDWEAASDEFNYIIEDKNINLDEKINIAASYYEKAVADSSLFPIAKNLFEKIDKDTLDWQVKMYLGAIAFSEGNDSLAIDNFKYVTENANWNVQAWIRLGGLLYDNKKYDEASKVMEEAIEVFPNDFAANFILGLSLVQLEKQEEAEKYLSKAVDLNPNDVNALSAYGYTLSQLKKNKEAIRYITHALRIEPDDVNLIGTLGLIYNSIQMHAESDSAYERALELDPENSLINNNYSYALAVRGEQLERALEMVKVSIAADSLNSSYLDTIGWVYYKLGDYDQAKKYLEKAIELNQNSAVILDHLGDVEFKLGNSEKAVELWEKAFELDPQKNEIKTKIEKGEL
ncbi:MAG: tetratricopeptide repeat protein [Ignavibacterium sp.]|nr:tetratricopeptide repeat protein [Ignavibacterium sp.]